jgi:hypothetical protein
VEAAGTFLPSGDQAGTEFDDVGRVVSPGLPVAVEAVEQQKQAVIIGPTVVKNVVDRLPA